ncbi:serine hydrolase domain-containing protein [Amycolatopsis sp. WQ 127309]|uniref:serine hydrolase domain-containing protein n=1 Tax=Amycolatopsis sp. WQ 127309 TaxID=2932773 RepID=UPI001FF15AB1|nr:serine hydrolase domain-containing protein [Amycolatopsis sp. WQ 127309]UOZ03673.1 beta-lactamase family protein [Amycolatopsis sp. WQ 127309]
MAHIEGTCDERFEAVRDALAASLDKDDVGASVAVYVDGAPVVDLWGGYADEARTRPWERDTITAVWSTTKTMTALCALILADRGELDLDAPVAAYWPEFAAAGKGDVRVRHVLGHTAGLPSWDEPLTVERLYDWPAMTALLAAQAPASAPGTVGAYHAVTQGYLAGEVIRRVTGHRLGRFFAEEVAAPLGADFHIGLAPEHDHRVAPVIPATTRAPEFADRGPGNPDVPAEVANTEAWQRADIPSASGFGNARSVAAVQSVLTSGGRGLLSAAGCERALEEQFAGEDQVLGARIRYGMGYAVQGRSCSWGGWGGSLVMNDFDRRMTVAYVMNRMLEEGPLGDDRGLSVVMATFDS